MSLWKPSPRRVFNERFVLVLVVTDLAMCACSVLIAFGIRSLIPQPLLQPLRHDVFMYLRAIPVVAGLWLITFHSLGLYAPRRFAISLGEMSEAFRGVTLTAIMVAAASFLSRTDYSRAMVFLFWAAALCLTVVNRWILQEYVERVRARGGARARTVVVGCGDLARVVAARIRNYEVLGYELVGFVSVFEHPDRVGDYPVVGEISELDAIVTRYDVDEVLVSRPDVDPGTLMTAIQSCGDKPVEFHLVAGLLQMLTESAEISGLADLPVIQLPPQRFQPWQSALKRGIDVVLSVALLIILAPLLLVIAWLVRRGTDGGAIFQQNRVGYKGAEFAMYKFRTMVPGAPAYAESPSDPDDERITRVGRWLRASSLDELPQLLNVLRGEMSIVGPRPEMPFIVEQYEPWQRCRLEVKPGITGLWQILGRKDLPLRENIEYDFYYIRNWSIWLDLSIFLRTIPVVVKGRGAY